MKDGNSQCGHEDDKSYNGVIGESCSSSFPHITKGVPKIGDNKVIGESCSSSSPQVTKGVPKIGEKRI